MSTENGHVYHVYVGNAWGQRWNYIAATPELASSWADKAIEELVASKEETEAPDYDGWSKSRFQDIWSPDGDTEDWDIRVNEYELKTEEPVTEEVEA